MLENKDVDLYKTGNIKTVSKDDIEVIQTFDHPQLNNIMLLFSNEVNSILSERLDIPLIDFETRFTGIKQLKSNKSDGSLTEEEINKVVQDLVSIIREHKE